LSQNSPAGSGIEWVRPSQERGRASMLRMLEATELQLRNSDFDEVTVQDIVAEAGTSVGSFYSRFLSKTGLLQCLQERFVSERRDLIRGVLDEARRCNASLEERLGMLLHALEGHVVQRAGLARTLRVRELRRCESASSEGADLDAWVVDACCECLLDGRNEIGCAQPERAVRLVVVGTLLTLEQVLLFPDSSLARSLRAAREGLVEELCEQAAGQLRR